MPKFRAKDGFLYDVPDDPTPEEQAWMDANRLDGLKDAGKAALSGAAEGFIRAPLIGGDLLRLGMTGLGKAFKGFEVPEGGYKLGTLPQWAPGALAGQELRFDPGSQVLVDMLKERGAEFYEPKSPAGRYSQAIGAGLGGAAGFGLAGGPSMLGKMLLPANLAVAGTAGGASELGGDISRKFDESKPQNPLAKIAGGVAGGLVGGAARSAMSSNAKEELYKALSDTKPSEWAQARQNLDTFKRAGSQSYTLADALPPTTGLGGVTRDLSNTLGGRDIQRALGQGREEDMRRMVQNLLDELADPAAVTPSQLNQTLAGNATAEIQRLKALGRASRNANLAGVPDVSPTGLQQEAAGLYSRSMAPGVFGSPRQGAYALGAQQLDPTWAKRVPGFSSSVPAGAPLPFTNNVRALADRVQSFSNVPAGVPATTPAAALGKGDRIEVAKLLDEALRRQSPGYAQSMDDGLTFRNQVLQPREAGPLGQMAGSVNPIPSFQRAASQEVGPLLNIVAPTQDLKLQLARALGEQGGLRPINPMAGNAQYSQHLRDQLAQVLDEVVPGQGSRVQDLGKTLDTLSRLRAEPGMDVTVRQNLSKNPGAWMTPFSEVGRRSRLLTSEKEVRKIADLLTKPTPENLAKLQALAKTDPRMARYLGWLGIPAEVSGPAQLGDRQLAD